jgi:hypothetical protein
VVWSCLGSHGAVHSFWPCITHFVQAYYAVLLTFESSTCAPGCKCVYSALTVLVSVLSVWCCLWPWLIFPCE